MPDRLAGRGVLDAVADLALICSADLRITAINATGAAILGLPADDLVGRELFDFVAAEDGAASAAR